MLINHTVGTYIIVEINKQDLSLSFYDISQDWQYSQSSSLWPLL